MVPQLRQVFERVGGNDGGAPADARFEHFRSAMWPRLQSSGGSGAPLKPLNPRFLSRGGAALLEAAKHISRRVLSQPAQHWVRLRVSLVSDGRRAGLQGW